jgi:hypothetical protein
MEFWASLSDYLGFFLWIVIGLVYLMAAFTIIGDLMNDRELSGFAKAVWVVLLVLVPFLTAIVYLIARGKGIADRRDQARLAAQSYTDQYIRDVVAGTVPVDQIAKAKALLDSGAIDEVEFTAIKRKALTHT